MESIDLLTIVIGILLIAGISKRTRGTLISLPILYTLFGLFVGLVFSDLVRLSFDDPVVELIATLTLVMVLASDASRIKLKSLRSYHNLPLRLLGIGLPLTIALGAVLAAAIFGDLGIWGAVILAVILAPTDASLGESVVENPGVPGRIRQALNIESGLNDGIALPFLLLAISMGVSSEIGLGSGYFVRLTAAQIVFGILAGLVVGYLGARYIFWGLKSGWMSASFQKISWLALVLVTFGVAELIGGNGFIAAFVFGITSGNTISQEESDSLYHFAQVENTLLMLVTYIIFGMVMLAPALANFNLTILFYALLSLTVIRMLPVAISMIGTNLQPVTVLFLGWFGPRGIASILYVLTVMETENLVGKGTIYNIVMATVFISVIAHGISAAPLSDWYAKRVAALDKDGLADAETMPVSKMATRRGAPSVQSAGSGSADGSA